MNPHSKKETPFERVLFFCDAVVAIAITLLALELKVEIPNSQHLSFADLVSPWHLYIAFFLSFINIAGYWHTHHSFFTYIKKMDEKLIYLNISWLFFIITIPFSTSLLSSHFGDTTAICLYSSNVFMLSVLQNFIWDYADNKPHFVDRENLTVKYQSNLRWMLKLDMLNGIIAIATSFYMPKTAFFLLFFKIPIVLLIPFLFKNKMKKK